MFDEDDKEAFFEAFGEVCEVGQSNPTVIFTETTSENGSPFGMEEHQFSLEVKEQDKDLFYPGYEVRVEHGSYRVHREPRRKPNGFWEVLLEI